MRGGTGGGEERLERGRVEKIDLVLGQGIHILDAKQLGSQWLTSATRSRAVMTRSTVPSPRPVDPASGRLADCSCGALHQAEGIVDGRSSYKSRYDEKGLARVRDDAWTGHAIQGLA
jgi:hypothetical protein